MRGWIIDDDGIVWSEGEPELLRRHNVHRHWPAFATFAVRNLGYLHASHAGDAFVIRLRPDTVSSAALIGAALLLGDLRPGRSAIALWQDGGWRYRLLGHWRNAINFVSGLERRPASVAARVKVRRCALEGMPARTPLSQLLQHWGSYRRVLDNAFWRDFAGNRLADRYVLLRPARDRGELLIEQLGAGYPYSKSYRSMARGLRFVDQPDVWYARAISESYREAATSGMPVVDEIDAVIEWPHLGKTETRYRRLIVPLDDGAGNQLLLSTSMYDPSIRLRSEAL